MSTLKPLTPRRRKFHSVFLMVVIAAACGLGVLQKYPQKGSVAIFVLLFVVFAAGFLAAAVVGRPLRCPDCGKFLREQHDHPKSQETYLYYCRKCDVTWDTLIQRSQD